MRYALGHRSSPFHRFGAICGVPSASRTIYIDTCHQPFHQMTLLPLYEGKLVATEKKTTNTDPTRATLLKPRLEWAIAAQRRQWRRGSGARVAFRAPRSGDSGGGSRGA